MQESEHGKFLRTVLRKDVYDKLESLAKSYSTGRGDWDFGVVIQMLLDFYDNHSTVAQINGKLDVLLSSIYSQPEPDLNDEVKEDPGTEMLGGEILEK